MPGGDVRAGHGHEVKRLGEDAPVPGRREVVQRKHDRERELPDGLEEGIGTRGDVDQRHREVDGAHGHDGPTRGPHAAKDQPQGAHQERHAHDDHREVGVEGDAVARRVHEHRRGDRDHDEVPEAHDQAHEVEAGLLAARRRGMGPTAVVGLPPGVGSLPVAGLVPSVLVVRTPWAPMRELPSLK